MLLLCLLSSSTSTVPLLEAVASPVAMIITLSWQRVLTNDTPFVWHEEWFKMCVNGKWVKNDSELREVKLDVQHSVITLLSFWVGEIWFTDWSCLEHIYMRIKNKETFFLRCIDFLLVFLIMYFSCFFCVFFNYQTTIKSTDHLLYTFYNQKSMVHIYTIPFLR